MATDPPKVAAIQMASGPNLAANLMEAERRIAEAARSGARLVVLPENFGFMGKRDQEILGYGERPGVGPLQQFLAQAASRYGIWLVGGTIPMLSEDPQRLRAACLVMDPRGRQVGRYDKIHLFDVQVPGSEEHYRESAIIEPGADTLVVDTPLGHLGIAVCYDLRFPELFRCLLDRGMELLALPAAFTAVTGRAHWDVLVRARAIENLVFVIAAAQGGYHISGRETYGHSLIVDPWGTVLAEAGRGAGSVVAGIDLQQQRATRSNFPVIEHRRLKCQRSAPSS